ncbi:methyltransferase [Pseudomaricurvus sp.]|uniref:methyltransferase n=1 Tax=Pseudomaricurvus sp. TaxID=2004510 RepID=UPI003F6CB220
MPTDSDSENTQASNTPSDAAHTDHRRLNTAFGTFELDRVPEPHTTKGKQQPLRAWDAADEYLLQWLDEQPALGSETRTLILNDSFGALTVALRDRPCWSQTDSLLARRGCGINLSNPYNVRAEATQQVPELLTSLQWPTQVMNLVVMKIPKTLALLEDQLFQLRSVIDQDTVIVAAAMTKNIHNSTLALFEKILGTTTTSLARKKARLIFCQPQMDQWQGESPYPSSYSLPQFPFAIHNLANVFSRGGLDIGTRFLLEHFPQLPEAKSIIDLGCGNGLLGIQAKHLHPQALVRLVDESCMAVESARLTIESAQAAGYITGGRDDITPDVIISSEVSISSKINNSLEGIDDASADLIVNNPPFHQQSVIGDHIAWKMFTDAKRVLRQGGELWVVGNRHLDYHIKLKRLFGHCETVASNRKFVILRSRKR